MATNPLAFNYPGMKLPEAPKPTAAPLSLMDFGKINQEAKAKADFENSTDLTRFGPSPFTSPLKDMTTKVNSFNPTPFNYAMKDTASMKLPQYDAIRNRINQGFLQTQQKSQEDLDRQFAAMGGGPGNGAQLKQTENLAGEIARAKADAMSQVDVQELADRQRMQEAEEGRGFQAGMFNASQLFDSWKTRMALGADIGGKLAALDMQWAEASQEAINNKFNRELAKYTADNQGGLFGGGGFLGLGI